MICEKCGTMTLRKQRDCYCHKCGAVLKNPDGTDFVPKYKEKRYVDPTISSTIYGLAAFAASVIDFVLWIVLWSASSGETIETPLWLFIHAQAAIVSTIIAFVKGVYSENRIGHTLGKLCITMSVITLGLITHQELLRFIVDLITR